jgi:hypothetical protein
MGLAMTGTKVVIASSAKEFRADHAGLDSRSAVASRDDGGEGRHCEQREAIQ